MRIALEILNKHLRGEGGEPIEKGKIGMYATNEILAAMDEYSRQQNRFWIDAWNLRDKQATSLQTERSKLLGEFIGTLEVITTAWDIPPELERRLQAKLEELKAK